MVNLADSSDDENGKESKKDNLSGSRSVLESAKKDDYKSLYEAEHKRAIELKETLASLEKKHKELEKMDGKCDMIDLLHEV